MSSQFRFTRRLAFIDVSVTGTAFGCRLILSGDRYAARRCFA